jgi:hypothetical protein
MMMLFQLFPSVISSPVTSPAETASSSDTLGFSAQGTNSGVQVECCSANGLSLFAYGTIPPSVEATVCSPPVINVLRTSGSGLISAHKDLVVNSPQIDNAQVSEFATASSSVTLVMVTVSLKSLSAHVLEIHLGPLRRRILHGQLLLILRFLRPQ